MRKLFTCLLFLACLGTAFAQVSPKEYRNPVRHSLKGIMERRQGLKSVLPMHRAPKRAIELNSGQMWFGYIDDEQATDLGLEANCDYNLAIYIPYGKIAGAGATIDGISFWLQSQKVKNLKVWATTDLPEIGEYNTGADLEIKEVPQKDYTTEGYTEVAFAKSHVIPEDGIWLGVSFEIQGMPDAPDDSEVSDEDYEEWYFDVYMPWLMENEADAYPFFASQATELIDGSMVFASEYYDDMYRYYADLTGDDAYLDFLGWDDYSTSGYCVGIKALIGGDKFLNYAATPNDLGETYALINNEVTFPLTLTNNGKNGISSFTYEVSINGTKTDEQTITTDSPVEGLLKSYSTDVVIKMGETTGKKDIVLTITKVNGQPNEALKKTAEGSVIVLAESTQKIPLIEEFTGTWCQWCPRGMVGMGLLSRDFKGKAITLAIHNGDPMSIEAYDSFVEQYVSGFPSMFINRKYDVDPYYGSSEGIPYGVKDDVENAMSEIAAASVDVSAQWADASKTKINISTQTKVLFDEDEPSMSLGYIVVADGLKGSGRQWAQVNAYNGQNNEYKDDPNLSRLCNMGEYIMEMTYDHVVVAAWGIWNGVEGSLTGTVKANQPIASSFEADLSSVIVGSGYEEGDDNAVTAAELVAGKKVKVVAILFNEETGEIVNANETALQQDTAVSGINEPSVAQTGRYNLAGQSLTAPQRGLNILRLSNGKTVKVLVK